MAAQQQATKGEGWATFPIVCKGGLVLNQDILEQAVTSPGSAIQLINYEPSLQGGYKRILGYTKFDTSALTGSGAVLGSFIFNDQIIAQRGTVVSKGNGSGWTVINGADTRTAAVKCVGTVFEWDKKYLVVVDGGAGLKPYMFDDTATYTPLTNAPTGSTFCLEFKRYLWFVDGSELVTFSSPGQPNDYNALNGAGTINVGMGVTGMAAWRDELYLFNDKTIKKISGTSSANWVVSPVAEQVGCLNPFSLQELGGDILFLANDGIRNLSGTANINDRDLNNISHPINSVASTFSHSDLTSVIIRDKNQYRLVHSTQNSQDDLGIIGVNKSAAGYGQAAAWEWSTTVGLKMSCAHSGVYGSDDKVVIGDWNGFVYTLESGDMFGTAGIQSVFQTPHLVFSDPDVRKVLYKLCMFLRTEGSMTLSVGIIFDYSKTSVAQPNTANVTITGGSVYFDTGDPILFDVGVAVLFDSISAQKPCTNINGSGFSASFIFSGSANDENATHVIQSISTQFREGAKR